MSLVREFGPGLGELAFLHALASSPPGRAAAEAGAVPTCERGFLDVQCRNRTAPEAAAHADASAAAVSKVAATFRSGVRARTAPGDRPKSLPGGERRGRGSLRFAIGMRGGGRG